MWSLILTLIHFFVFFYVTLGDEDESVEVRVGFEKQIQVAKDRQFPYVGFFAKTDEYGFKQFFCGGSIIHQKWVLTAGHCCEEVHEKDITFTAGTIDLRETSQPRRVVRFFAHQSINQTFFLLANGTPTYTNVYDIGVARLDEALVFDNYVQPIILNRSKQRDLIGKTVTYMGWGITSENSSVSNVDIMLYSQAKVIGLEECQKRMTGRMLVDPKLHICTIDDVNNTSTCEGDSGGPLVFEKKQIAVTTDVFCSEKRPSVFHNVAVFFSWIRRKLLVCGDEIYENYGTAAPKDYQTNRPQFNEAECYKKTSCKKAKSNSTTESEE